MNNRVWNYPPESSSWRCTWQDEYGTWGTLPQCLGFTDGYREYDSLSPYRSKSEVIDVLAKFGSAKGFWWSIEYDGDDDEVQ
jgi:hypothetical protein